MRLPNQAGTAQICADLDVQGSVLCGVVFGWVGSRYIRTFLYASPRSELDTRMDGEDRCMYGQDEDSPSPLPSLSSDPVQTSLHLLRTHQNSPITHPPTHPSLVGAAVFLFSSYYLTSDATLPFPPLPLPPPPPPPFLFVYLLWRGGVALASPRLPSKASQAKNCRERAQGTLPGMAAAEARGYLSSLLGLGAWEEHHRPGRNELGFR